MLNRLGHIASEVKDFVAGLGFAPVRLAAADAVDLVFPPSGEDDPSLQGGLAAGPWSRIRFLADEGCDMCARPFDGGLHYGKGALCSDCADKPFPFTRTRAACLYGEASKDLILGFKHGDRLDLAPMLSRWLERAGNDMLRDTDIVMPVPLHASRLRERRYNQAAELARPIARRAGLIYAADALSRVRATKSQGHASARMRWDNVRGAFAVTASGRRQVAGRRVVLIDDVFTTGATLRACADALKASGARQVDTLVIARAVPQPEL
nr:ComF family protein [Asticcacaulis solisilvae]